MDLKGGKQTPSNCNILIRLFKADSKLHNTILGVNLDFSLFMNTVLLI